jgi:hypothetical protein
MRNIPIEKKSEEMLISDHREQWLHIGSTNDTEYEALEFLGLSEENFPCQASFLCEIAKRRQGNARKSCCEYCPVENWAWNNREKVATCAKDYGSVLQKWVDVREPVRYYPSPNMSYLAHENGKIVAKVIAELKIKPL